MKKTLAILNAMSVVLVISVNYLSQALRLNDTTIAERSKAYENLFTPAGYAFAIWGLIFLSLLGYAAFQLWRVFGSKEESTFVEQTGYWFLCANVLNSAWVFAFVYDYTGVSVLIMLGILLSLCMIIVNTNMERWDAPLTVIAFVWWPISLYSGWIAVATIANIAAYLTKLGWDGFGIGDVEWTIAMILAATAINLVMVWTRNMREFALVGIWALVAIFVRHRNAIDSVAYAAVICSAVLVVAIVVHGYKNRATNPVSKALDGT
tara:strand:+ start:24988 stop:25779 length:792 start_codon:yes stop_codon:yes gene_type:complete